MYDAIQIQIELHSLIGHWWAVKYSVSFLVTDSRYFCTNRTEGRFYHRQFQFEKFGMTSETSSTFYIHNISME